MTPEHDPLESYYARLAEGSMSADAETELYRRLHQRKPSPFLLWSVPPAALAAAYAFLMWCAASVPADVDDVGHPLLKQQMTSAGLLPDGSPVDTSSLPGRGV